MNFQETYDYYQSLQERKGIVPGLDTIRELLSRLGNPQEQLKIIHVAGTNGKGSVTAFLASVLKEAGYKVGRFNSPVVFSFGEQIRVDEEPVSEGRFASAFSAVRTVCEQMEKEGLPHPTVFEAETAAAFLCFLWERTDVSIVEVGMGGKEDATNVISSPLVSVLTSISMDHMGFLGNSLEEIAQVKAGIIKDYRPCVSVRQPEEAMAVIEQTCREMGSVLAVADAGKAQDVREGENGIAFRYEERLYQLSMHGSFQVENAICAIETIKMLQFAEPDLFPDISREDIRRGLSGTRWGGRLEKISSNPEVYIDGAHNIGAAKNLKKSLELLEAGSEKVSSNGGTVYVMGVLADKDYEQIAEIMFSPGDSVFCVTPQNSRGLDADTLADVLNGMKVNAVSCKSTKEAMELSRKACGENGRIVVFGSLSFLSEVKSLFLP